MTKSDAMLRCGQLLRFNRSDVTKPQLQQVQETIVDCMESQSGCRIIQHFLDENQLFAPSLVIGAIHSTLYTHVLGALSCSTIIGVMFLMLRSVWKLCMSKTN